MQILIFQHLPHEGAGNIIAWTQQRNYNVLTLLLPEWNEELPTPSQFDMLFILGGTMSVNDEHKLPWMKKEKEWIKEFILTNRPVVGICLGSQLLAEALGSHVYKNKQKEIGFFAVQKVDAYNPTLQHIPNQWSVFHWHGETFDLPVGAQHLFSSEACQNQAFQKNNCFGFQFHPEADEELISAMIEFERCELVKSEYVQTETEIKNEFHKIHSSFFHTFLDKISMNNSD